MGMRNKLSFQRFVTVLRSAHPNYSHYRRTLYKYNHGRNAISSTGGFSLQFASFSTPASLPALDKLKKYSDSLEKYIQEAKDLLDKQKIEPGKFKERQYKAARRVLSEIGHPKMQLNPESVTVVFQLLGRLVEEELQANIEKARFSYVPPFLKSLLKTYARSYTRHPEQVIAPYQVLEMLHGLAQLNPKFRYNSESVDVLLDAALKVQNDVNQAPELCEQFLQPARQQALELQYPRLIMDARLHNRLLSVWIKSKRPERHHEIEIFLDRMIKEGVKPNIDIYCTLLLYWGQKGSATKVDELIQQSKKQSVPRNAKIMQSEITAFCNVGQADRAERVLWKLVKHCTKEKFGGQVIVEATRQVLERLTPESFARMEKLIHKLKECSLISPAGITKLDGYLVHYVYAPAGKYNEAEETVSRMNYRTSIFAEFLSQVAKQDINRAIQILKTAVQKENFERPDIILIHFLLHSMAENPSDGIFEKAYDLIHFMEADPKFVKAGIRPTIGTFNLLMKCIVSSKGVTSEKVDAVLDDIKSRCTNEENGFEMEEVTYNRAMKAYAQCKDINRALSLLKSMEKSRSPPTSETYSYFMKHLLASSVEDNPESLTAHAELVESALMRLREASKPTVGVLSDYCYNVALTAWGRCGPQAADQLLQIYDLMAADHVPNNAYTYDKVISVLSKSTRLDLIEKAESMLREMMDDVSIQPQMKHYVCVANAWMNLGGKFDHRVYELINLCVQEFLKADMSHESKLPGFFTTIVRMFMSQGDTCNFDVLIDQMAKILDNSLKLSSDTKCKIYCTILDELMMTKSLENPRREKVESLIASLKQSNQEISGISS